MGLGNGTTAYRRALPHREELLEKVENEVIAEAFRARLRDVGGFANVPAPMAMRNDQGFVVYYLFFASQNDAGNRVVEHIFRKHAGRP